MNRDAPFSVIVFLFYYLARSSAEVEKLRAELKGVKNILSNQELQTLPHLNGVINEALRLYPAVLSNALRSTPPEGILVGGTHIPGNATVSIPHYSLGRRELPSR